MKTILSRLCVLTLVLVVLAPASGFAAPAIAAKIQQKYDSIQAMQFTFNQLLEHRESGKKEKRSGVFLFKKPLLVRWETKTPAPELLLVTAREIWNVFPDEELAYKYPLSMVQDSRSIVKVITGQARLDTDFDVEEEGSENGMLKLRIYPHEPVQALVEATLWVDPASYMITKVRIIDFYGNANEIAFFNVKTDVNPSASQFTFTPPKGFEVEDRTKMEGDVPHKPLLN